MLFIPLALGQIFPNCPPPTHSQLTYIWFQGKITRWEVHKFDLLTYSRFTRTPTPDEGSKDLRPGCILHSISFGSREPSQVLAFRLVLLSDQSSHSASRRWSPRCFTGCGPQACAPEWSALTFGPEGGLPGPRCLGCHRAPFGHSCYPTPGPCRQVRRCFRGWD